MKPQNSAFIPAREKRWFIFIFRWYLLFLLKRRFKGIYLKMEKPLEADSSVLFYGNHFYWWDALMPLYLSVFVWKVQPRAIMEDKQMRQYPFFSWIGAFSIDRTSGKYLTTTLKYALDWLKSPGNALFIYPNGEFTNPLTEIPPFAPGLHWIASHAQTQCLPTASYIDFSTSDKPLLFIACGKPVEIVEGESRQMWLERARTELSELLQKLPVKDFQASFNRIL